VSRLSVDESDCVSQLQLDRYFGGELSDAQRTQLERHIQRCEHCAATKHSLAEERAAFLARVPTWESLHSAHDAVRPRRVPWQWLSGAAATLAAAAALLIVTGEPQSFPGTRLKGRPSINLYLKRADRVTRATSGDTFIAGDLLRVAYTSREPVHLALLQRDAEGVVVHYPYASESTVRVAAGRDVTLDFSIQLDAHEGAEQLLALFCDRPTQIEPVRAAWQQSAALPEVSHCQLDELVLNKKASP
jgi:hypothetical protein